MTISNAPPTASGPRSPSTSAAWAPAALNFHYEVFARMGYEAQARAIQDAYLAGDKKSAIAAVPTGMVEDVALIGPWAKIADEIQRWKQTVLTTFLISCDLRLLPKVADLVSERLAEPGGRQCRREDVAEAARVAPWRRRA